MLVREKLQREKLGGWAGKRAWGFERRLEEEKGSELARKCLREMKERAKEDRANSDWEKGRRKFFEDRGIRVEKMERRCGAGELEYRELENRDRQRQEEERWKKIGDSKYSRWYGRMKGRGILGYLKKGWGESRWRKMERFSLRSEMRKGRYWEKREKKICRLCELEEETCVGEM